MPVEMTQQMKDNSSEEDPFNFDSLLNLEQKYYDEGFREGQLTMTKQQFKEGKELGIQTGFQRFLVIGEYQSLIQIWISKVENLISDDNDGGDNKNDSRPKDWKKVRDQLLDVKRLVDSLFENDELNISNKEADVVQYESILKRAKVKIRALSATMGDLETFKGIEGLNSQIGGNIQVSNTINDDTW